MGDPLGMNISVILAHPTAGSFNHAIASRAVKVLTREGHDVFSHDLYQERFDPILTGVEIFRGAKLPPDIQRHCGEIAEADGIVVIHPNWWGQPPAILKGWVDRVIRPGIAYEFLEGDKGDGIPKGLLKARAALVFNTSNTPEERERRAFGDPLETLWKNCVFGLCGVEKVHRKTFCVVVTSTAAERAQWLQEVEDDVCRYFANVKPELSTGVKR
jgi:NAD(P)H dehydrogenase (quinone)